MRRLCKEYPGALPGDILRQDAGLLLQLLDVERIITDEQDALRGASAGWPAGTWPETGTGGGLDGGSW